MNKAMKILAICAATAMPVQGAMANSDCVPQRQFSAMGVYLLPGLLKRSMDECRPFLPANAGLLTKGPAAIKRYKNAAGKAEDQAAVAVLSLVGDAFPTQLGGKLALPVVEAMLQGELRDSFDKSSCQAINNIWTPMAALPAADVGRMAAGLMLAVGENDSKDDQKSSDANAKNSENPVDNLSVCPFVAR